MLTIQGYTVYLRALEPEDLEFIYAVENDLSVWEISNTQTPYSRFLIKQYLEKSQQDIYEAKQLRLAICKKEDNLIIGLIDLFDFDPQNKRAGIGVLIYQEDHRHVGLGSQALKILIDYSFNTLNLHQLYANIGTDNIPSLTLFTKFGFTQIGIKKQWNLEKDIYKDEYLFQLINNK